MSACCADLEYVRVLRVSIEKMMAFIAIAIDGTLLEMPAMCEITDGERIPCPLIQCQRYRLAGVARSASREFLPG